MIRWITSHLGTAAFEEIQSTDDYLVIDVRDLVDRAGNTNAAIKQKIEQGTAGLAEGRKVVVCCDYGMSRSTAVAIGVVSLFEDIPFELAAKKVLDALEQKNIKVEVLNAVRRAVVPEEAPLSKNPDRRRVLVTGATGFIGRSLCDALKNRCRLFETHSRQIDLAGDAAALNLFVREKGIDTIVHLAHARVYTPNHAMGESLVMLKNVLDVCQENNVRLIFPSSVEVFHGYMDLPSPILDNMTPNPKGTFGQTKHLCEVMIRQYKRLYGTSSLILRLSTLYGGKAKPRFLHGFIQKARKNQVIITHKYRNGFPELDLLHIDDLVQALCVAIESSQEEVMNLGSSKAVTTCDIAQMIVQLLGSNSEISHIEVDDYAPNIIMDISLARTRLQFNPGTDIVQGLRALIA